MCNQDRAPHGARGERERAELQLGAISTCHIAKLSGPNPQTIDTRRGQDTYQIDRFAGSDQAVDSIGNAVGQIVGRARFFPARLGCGLGIVNGLVALGIGHKRKIVETDMPLLASLRTATFESIFCAAFLPARSSIMAPRPYRRVCGCAGPIIAIGAIVLWPNGARCLAIVISLMRVSLHTGVVLQHFDLAECVEYPVRGGPDLHTISDTIVNRHGSWTPRRLLCVCCRSPPPIAGAPELKRGQACPYKLKSACRSRVRSCFDCDKACRARPCVRSRQTAGYSASDRRWRGSARATRPLSVRRGWRTHRKRMCRSSSPASRRSWACRGGGLSGVSMRVSAMISGRLLQTGGRRKRQRTFGGCALDAAVGDAH